MLNPLTKADTMQEMIMILAQHKFHYFQIREIINKLQSISDAEKVDLCIYAKSICRGQNLVDMPEID